MSTIITFIICSVLLIGKFDSCYVAIEILNTDPLKKNLEMTVFIWIDRLYACVDWGVSEMPFLFKCYELYLWRNNTNEILLKVVLNTINLSIFLSLEKTMCVYQKYTWKIEEFYNKIIIKHKLPNKSAACNKNIKLWTSLPKIV